MKKIKKSKIFFIFASLVLVAYFFISMPYNLNFINAKNAKLTYWEDNCSNVVINTSIDVHGEKWVEISTEEQLAYLCKKINENIEDYKNCNIRLLNNLNLGSKIIDGIKKAMYWTPIRNFSKTFDGNGFKISGLRIEYDATNIQADERYACGFISSLTGIIKNVIFEDCYIAAGAKPWRIIGLVVGEVFSGTIDNCKVILKNNARQEVPYTTPFKMVVQSDNKNTFAFGGIVGYAKNSTITNCFVEDTTSQRDGFNLTNYSSALASNKLKWAGIGGIVGTADGSIITLCKSNIAIKGINNINEVCVGGIVGNAQLNQEKPTSITKSCNYGNITVGDGYGASTIETAYIGGIAGVLKSGGNKIENCFNVGNIVGYVKQTKKEYDIGSELKEPSILISLELKADKNREGMKFDVSLCNGNYTNSSYAGYFNNVQYTNKVVYEGNFCYKGGIVGYIANNSIVQYCYNIGNIDVTNSGYDEIYSYYYKLLLECNVQLDENGYLDCYVENYNTLIPNYKKCGTLYNVIQHKITIKNKLCAGSVIGGYDSSYNIMSLWCSDEIEYNEQLTLEQYVYKNDDKKENCNASISDGLSNEMTNLGIYVGGLFDEDAYTCAIGVNEVSENVGYGPGNYTRTRYDLYSVIMRCENINLHLLKGANTEFLNESAAIGVQLQPSYYTDNQDLGIKFANKTSLMNSLNKGVWSIDSNGKINSGYPYLKEMYWQNSIENIEEPDNIKFYFTTNEQNKTVTLNKVEIVGNVEVVKVPETFIDEDGESYAFTEIGAGAFAIKDTSGKFIENKDSPLKQVILPNTIETIGSNAFYGCSNLEKINMPTALKTISSQSFDLCKKLQNVNLPNGLEIIGNLAFASCNTFTEIIIPNSVKTIGDRAFGWTSSLTKITAPFIGNSRTATGEKALLGYWFGDSANKTYLTEVQQRYSQEDNSIKLKRYIPTTLTTIKITEGEEIKPFTFYACTMLKSITYPSSVTKIGAYAFDTCTSLEGINLSSVNIIEQYAFDSCTAIQGLNFSAHLETVGEGAFAYCSGLKILINFDKCTKLTYLSKRMFYECTQLSYIILPNSIINIQNEAFYNCIATSISKLSSSLKMIGDGAFKKCIGINNINIPKGVEYIGESAFEECLGLTKLCFLGNNSVTISNRAFYNCKNLNNIGYYNSSLFINNKIPPNTIAILDNAFAFCESLEIIHISNNIQYIGQNVFEGCTNLLVNYY